MKPRLLTYLFLAPLAIASFTPAEAQSMRVPPSLASDSDSAGPMVPEFGYKKRQRLEERQVKRQQQKQQRKKAAKKVDPMKAIRSRMVAGKKVTDKELLRLADSGDDLGQFHYAKRLEERGDPEVLDTAAIYYLKSLASRDASERPLIRLLETGALDEEPKRIAEAEELLIKRAGKDDSVAREALIRMYRSGKPFGLAPEKADELLITAADAGNAKAALQLAYTALGGVRNPAKIEFARTYLTIAAKSEDLAIRAQAENILTGLVPGQPSTLTVATETAQ